MLLLKFLNVQKTLIAYDVDVSVERSGHQRRLPVLRRQSVDLHVPDCADIIRRAAMGMRENCLDAASAVLTSGHVKHRA